MIKNDYRDEIGVGAADKKVAWPAAIALLAIVCMLLAGLAWYFGSTDKAQNNAAESKNKTAATSSTDIGRNIT